MQRVRDLACFAGKDVVIKATSEVRDELQLGEGRTNQNFIVDSESRRFFVRIGADLPYYGVARTREHASTRAAAAVGLAPNVHHTELPDAMVLDFVEGKTLTEADVHEALAAGSGSPMLAAITRAIRRLHAEPVPQELTDFLSEVKGHIGWGGPHFSRWFTYAEEQGFSRLPLLDGLRGFVAELEAAAGPLGEGARPSFCHFDLLADNFVLQPSGEILLLDFEYAAPGRPLMDLAVLAMGCSLAAQEARDLLASYLEAEPTERQVYGFRALTVLAALRETFWGTTAELSGSSALGPEEARAYLEMNYGKFQRLRAEFGAMPAPAESS